MADKRRDEILLKCHKILEDSGLGYILYVIEGCGAGCSIHANKAVVRAAILSLMQKFDISPLEQIAPFGSIQVVRLEDLINPKGSDEAERDIRKN